MSKKSKTEPKLDKKAAKKLAEQQLAAEKAERKAAKKAGKKSPPEAVGVIVDEAGVEWVGETPPASDALVAAEKVLADPGASEGAKHKAAKIKGDVLSGMSDADLKARVQARRAALAILATEALSVDRDSADAVADFNARMLAAGGGKLLTSTAERDARVAEVKIAVPSDAEVDPLAVGPGDAIPAPEAWAAPTSVDELNARVESKSGRVKKLAAKPAPEPERMVAEVVATEEGDVIAVGPERPVMADVVDESIAVPSEAPISFEDNVNGLRQYKIKRPSDGRIVGYTRATTYIDNLEDKSAIEKWKARTILEGVALAEVEPGAERIVLAEVRDHLHRRDVTIAKARKADRKGKLATGQLFDLIADAEREWKKAAAAIAEDMLQAGGAHEKREKGTELHALCELADLEGVAAVEALVEAGNATPADLADVRAYLAACEAAGIKVLEVETVVVNDELKVAGRLDRVVMYKPEGKARGVRVVGDVKTGRIDFSAGKIAQQIRVYSTGEKYDHLTHERSPLGASKTLGLLIHLPAGKAECSIYEVDLTLGARGVKLSGEVRAWRNEGKRAFDLKAPIAHVSLAEVTS